MAEAIGNPLYNKANPISRVLYPEIPDFYHLSRPAFARRLHRPTRCASRRGGRRRAAFGLRNLFGLSTHEVYRNACRHARPWALTPRFHPYPALAGRYLFCGTFCPPPGGEGLPVRKRVALCCPDFPLSRQSGTAI